MLLKDFVINLIRDEDIMSWDKEMAEKAKWIEVRLWNPVSYDYDDYFSTDDLLLLLKSIDAEYLDYVLYGTDYLDDPSEPIFTIDICKPEYDEHDDDGDERLPRGYCEIEYDDMESEEAVLGCRFDDMNYLRYMER